MFIIEDFSESQGPACWHTLSTNNHKKEKLTALIPAYLGSGMAEESTLAFSQQAQAYERLFKNYLNIINAEFTVLDEFGDVISFIKLKSKGSSFNNKKEANKKAVINLIKKIETQMIKS